MSLRDRLFWEEKAREIGIAEALRIPHVLCKACGVEFAEVDHEDCGLCETEKRHRR